MHSFSGVYLADFRQLPWKCCRWDNEQIHYLDEQLNLMKKIKTLKLMLCLGLLAGMAPLGSRAAFDLRIYGGGAGLGGFDIEGTAVEALTGDDTYPDAPNAVETVTAVAGEGGIALIELTTGKFEFQQAFSGFSNGDSGLNNYGGAVSALLYPPATGTYILYISSDDASQLFLSTDDKRANMQLIAEETGCCNPLADHPSEKQIRTVHRKQMADFIQRPQTGHRKHRAWKCRCGSEAGKR